ncbi:L-seryl-tRNA(Sec) selenium transferase [Variovorax sp. PBS-H4]|uniref:L-seryl-tRNA(Sec) selenium transferase n=1 Tax=Variovorax sp. PBS-H4 TaxID=434008 RepID=UPI0013182E6F|nr:L-seryl-tRNA(Sec) selenium transferase [Variovorax sp. PBS-H4]VTU27504.1 L-seryl-tRNA(Sec) selenium transferase [Variovorax sp. PBS-H4]
MNVRGRLDSDMLTSTRQARRAIPAVDTLLKAPAFQALASEFGRPRILDCVRNLLAEQRRRLSGERAAAAPDEETLAEECRARLSAAARPSLRAVFNLTGTVLHTNLGRALYPAEAVAAATQAMARPVNLEYDVDGAGRGERDSHVEDRLLRLTGAEAAVVVNNNAAAVYLVLNTMAAGREVVVSRGELVEIGGAFRVPEIMASAGCVLREVGTTNRTHPRDFESAIAERTGALMKVHASNYEIRGFTAEVGAAKLAGIAHAHALPVIEDLGCGMLVDLEDFGLPHEPTPREAIAAGVDLVTFSGDKLLGGPQCGIIVGRKDLVARIRKNPMKRALRLDKVRLAALEAVLALYDDPERLPTRLPTLRLLTRDPQEIAAQAARLRAAVQSAVGSVARVESVSCASQIGSGALPVDTLPSAGLRLSPAGPRGSPSAEALAAAFRKLPVPVIGRIREDALWLDLRCLDEAQEAQFTGQLAELQFPGDRP